MRSSLERSEQAPGAKTPQRRRVLVVEDEELAYEGLCVELGHRGLAVDVARSVDGAMARLADTPYDAVILDIMLPQINGYKIARMLKFDETYKHIPIIMLTARTQQTDIKIGEETGADEYVSKPFNMDELVGLVKKYLRIDD